MELSCVFHTVSAHFFNDWIFHWPASSSSSGEQISGQLYPAFSTICLTIIRVRSRERIVEMSEIPCDKHVHAVDGSNRDMQRIFGVILRNAMSCKHLLRQYAGFVRNIRACGTAESLQDASVLLLDHLLPLHHTPALKQTARIRRRVAARTHAWLLDDWQLTSHGSASLSSSSPRLSRYTVSFSQHHYTIFIAVPQLCSCFRLRKLPTLSYTLYAVILHSV